MTDPKDWYDKGGRIPPAPNQPPPEWTVYSRPVGTNALAVASLVLGILWLGGIGSILAVALGHSAKKQIRTTGEKGEGLALTGMILGYVGIGFLALWIIILVAAAAGTSSG